MPVVFNNMVDQEPLSIEIEPGISFFKNFLYQNFSFFKFQDSSGLNTIDFVPCYSLKNYKMDSTVTTSRLDELIGEVHRARLSYIEACSELTPAQAAFKPDPESWSIVEVTEHLVWAEMGGINGIWQAAEGIRENRPVWIGEAVHHGLIIEEIIEKTWKEKELVPESARPRWRGSLNYWIASFSGCQLLLEALGYELTGMDLEKVIYPHPISGPLNVIQRMQFLRFHIQRHQKQMEKLISHPGNI